MSAIILAGGKSTRMGRDKAKLLVDGMTLLNRTILSLTPAFLEIIVCGRTIEDGQHLENVKYVTDIFKNVGPIGGIYTGLYYASDDMNFVTACDIPDININLVKYMESKAWGYDAVIIKIGEYTEPLFGFYSKKVMDVLKANIESGMYKIYEVFKSINVKYVTEEEIIRIEPNFRGLYNINTPKDYANYIECYSKENIK